MRDQAHIHGAVTRLSRHSDFDLLDQLRKLAPAPTEAAALETWVTRLAAALNDGHSAARYKLEARAAEEGLTLNAERILHGLSHRYTLGPDFFAGVDYQQMVRFNTQLAGLIGEGAMISRGERSQNVANFEAAYEWLLGETRRGLNIQRYKGLGEMNPEQLWETTLDPEIRRLVKVQVEDVVAADQMFTTLMGEDVEPRRDFIERHALLVSNLDV
jgi:DNA gyrase subunit B